MGRAVFSIGSVSAVLLAATSGTLLAQTGTTSEDNAAEAIVSTQLRAQGYKCDDPHSAQPDKGDSSPGETAWIIACGNATYRVKLVPDQAAKVEQID